MALTQPILYSTVPFDASTSHTFVFTVIGGDQVVKNKLTIQNADTLAIVYSVETTTFRYEHTLPSGTLTNGTQYLAYIQTINATGDISIASDTISFQCLTAATFGFNNISSGTKVNNASYSFSVTYNQEENDALNSCIFNLYSDAQILLSTSNEIYIQDKTLPYTMSYTFAGFRNNTKYYIECIGVSDAGVQVDTGKVDFLTAFDVPEVFSNIVLVNDCENGYIVFQSNVTAIDGETPRYPIYVDNAAIDLRGDGDYIAFNEGYTVTDDFTARIWGYDFDTNGDIITFSTVSGDIVTVALRHTGNTIWPELTARNAGVSYYYAIKGDEVSSITSTTNLCIFIQKRNNIYDVTIGKTT